MTNKLDLDRPIFIVGAGRTGTTLMRSLLSAHSRIAITPETHFLKRAESWGGLSSGFCDDFDHFWTKFSSWVRFKDLGVDSERCLELIGDHDGKVKYRDIFAAILRAYQEREGKPRAGEKTPKHTHYIGTLLEWFPDAKIIAMVRDPRAVVASRVKIPWVTRTFCKVSLKDGVLLGKRVMAVVHFAREWREIYCNVLPRWREDERMMLIHYESLVGAPREHMSQVCAFIGEEFEPEMTSAGTRSSVPPEAARMDSEEFDKWREEHHQRSVAPISSDSVEKWKVELSSTELAIVEGICGREMVEHGYQPELPRHRRAWGKALVRGLGAGARLESAGRKLARRVTGRVRGVAPPGDS